jgi:hypothetical protein
MTRNKKRKCTLPTYQAELTSREIVISRVILSLLSNKMEKDNIIIMYGGLKRHHIYLARFCGEKYKGNASKFLVTPRHHNY